MRNHKFAFRGRLAAFHKFRLTAFILQHMVVDEHEVMPGKLWPVAQYEVGVTGIGQGGISAE
ncbi:hypothetical protein FQZ97_1225850 [compost metagenome]